MKFLRGKDDRRQEGERSGVACLCYFETGPDTESTAGVKDVLLGQVGKLLSGAVTGPQAEDRVGR